MQSRPDYGSCQCIPGTYSSGGTCQPCPAGKWGNVAAAVSLDMGCAFQCPAGSWGSGVGMTSMDTACTNKCPPGRWGSNAGASSYAGGCFGSSPAGTWGTVSGTTSGSMCGNNFCPAGSWGAVQGATDQAAACSNLCPAGTYGVIKGKSTQVEACDSKCSFGTYGTITGQVSQSLACPGRCAAGTYAIATGQTSAALACSACTACMPGATTVVPCSNTTQTKCGAYVADTYNDLAVPGVSNPLFYVKGVSPPLLGVIPVAYTVKAVSTYTQFVMPTYTTNAMGISTAMTIADPSSYQVTIRIIAWCPSLGPDRVFKPWTPNPYMMVCPSDPSSCPMTTPVCDLAQATQCSGFTGAGGYYTGADGTSCVACTTSAPDPPCGWGEYGNISACSVAGDSKCAPCYGTKPANSVWTKSVAPHYVVGAPTCEWVCDVGFYLDASGTQCVACYLPDNGVFSGGDIIGGGEVVLRTAPTRISKYFGGSLAAGCRVVCNPGTNLGYPSIGAGNVFLSADVRCNPCFVPTCVAGHELVFINGQSCQACSACAAVANARFPSVGSCAFACNTGFVKLGGVCQPCSSSPCAVGQYRTRCTELVDSVCAACTSSCPSAAYTASACNATADRVCDMCPSPLLENGVVGPECVATCKLGWVYNGSSCLKCIQGCKADQEFLPVCEAQFLGCRPCPIPTTYAGMWCWTGNAIVSCQTKAVSPSDTTGCRIIPAQFLTTVLRTTAAFATSARLAIQPSTSAAPTTIFVFPSSSSSDGIATLAVVSTGPTATANLVTQTSVAPTTANQISVSTAPSAIVRWTSTTTRSGQSVSSSLPTTTRSGQSVSSSLPATTTTPAETGLLSLFSCAVASTSSTPPWCLVPQWNASVRAVFGPDAVVVGLQNGTVGAFLDCPNFTCPACVTGRRLLLSDNSTSWRIVFQWYDPSGKVDPAPYFANLTALDPTIRGRDTFLVIAQRVVERGTERVWVAIVEWAGIVQDAAVSSSFVPIVIGVVAGVGALLAVGVTLALY